MADMAKVISFLEGFEDDELQEGIPELIAAAKKADELLHQNLEAWEGEEDSVKEEHEDLITELRAFLRSDEKTCPDCNGLGAFPETGLDCGRCYGGGTIKWEGQ